MKQKRVLAMLMAGILAAGCLAGCGNTETETNTSTDAATSTEAAAGTEAASTEEGPWKPENPGPVTIDVMMVNHPGWGEGIDGPGLWQWAYFENWFKEEGYDVTFNVLQNATWDDHAQQMSLKCGTNQVPDLTFIRLEAKEQTTYGWQEGLLMDWTPYMNDYYMPNATAAWEAAGNPINLEILPNGEHYEYNLPGVRKGIHPDLFFLVVNKTIMNEAGYNEVPTTTQDFFDLMYAMKATHEHPDGFWSWNWRSSMGANYFFWGPNQMWTYPNSTWGTRWFFKTDGTVEYGAASPVYGEMVSTYAQWYADGILHPDCLVLDNTTKAAMWQNGQFGTFSSYVGDYYTVGVDAEADANRAWENILWVQPLTNSKTGQKSITHVNPTQGGSDAGAVVSADSEAKELIVYMIDHCCKPEIGHLVTYGPKAGEDPLGLVDGWTLDENNEMVPPAGYDNMDAYIAQKITPWIGGNIGNEGPLAFNYSYEVRGAELESVEREFVDSVTGKTETWLDEYPTDYWDLPDEEKTWALYINHITQHAWDDTATTVLQQDVYLPEDVALTATEIEGVIKEYAIAEGAKFTTGQRPIEELDDYYATLEEMGIAELTEIYNEAYAPYLNTVFGK